MGVEQCADWMEIVEGDAVRAFVGNESELSGMRMKDASEWVQDEIQLNCRYRADITFSAYKDSFIMARCIAIGARDTTVVILFCVHCFPWVSKLCVVFYGVAILRSQS